MAGLSCSIAVLLEKLDSVLKLPGFTNDNDLKRLESELKSFSKVITDADWRQLHNSSVKSWLQALEDAVYDAEDVLDEILFYEATGSKATETNEEPMRSIKKIVKVIEAITEQKDQFGFTEVGAHIELPWTVSESLPVSNETAIYGRKEERSEVLHSLLSGDEKLNVIALVGMVGMGKTTLAQQVFNDEKVSKHFQLRAWIHVGFNFDVHRITSKILENFTGRSFEGYSLDGLQAELRASLAGKKFLLVLDYVWNEDDVHRKWDALQSSLRHGASGSKVIVTTSNGEIAAVMGCSTPVTLRPLEDDHCWSIVDSFAFAGRQRNKDIIPPEFPKKIKEKCHGLPLIARKIGELLRSKNFRREWMNFQKALNSPEFLEQLGDSILPILWPTYYHLPAQLKRCFAYFSLFPRNHWINKEELVLLWMAEGFLQQSSSQSMEMVGAECFNGFLKRSFFVPDDNSRLIMHDLMYDLAEYVSGPVYFRFYAAFPTTIPERTRHLLLDGRGEIAFDLNVMLKTERLRTFYLIHSASHHIPEKLAVVLERQQMLRVILLPDFRHDELPATIGNLKYLRHLDVSRSELKRLPESMCTLYSLQTLILSGFQHDELPAAIGNLKHLRHLDVSRSKLKRLPESTLYSLQTLILTECSSLLMLPQGIVKLVHLQRLHIKGAGLAKMLCLSKKSKKSCFRAVFDCSCILLAVFLLYRGFVTSCCCYEI